MPRDILESDWRIFKELHQIALDRFFENTVKEMQPLLWAKNRSPREQFWDTIEFGEERKTQARRLFNDFRRSTAELILAMIYAENLLTEQEIARLSPQLQAKLQSIRDVSV